MSTTKKDHGINCEAAIAAIAFENIGGILLLPIMGEFIRRRNSAFEVCRMLWQRP